MPPTSQQELTPNTRKLYRTLGYFLLALLLASLLGSLVQSLLNLQAIARITGHIAFADWLATCWFDVRHFAPILALIMAPGLAAALWISRYCYRWLGHGHYWMVFIIAALALVVTLAIINYLAPMPTLIAANREWPGTLLLASSQGIGATLFAWLARHNKRS